MAFTCFGIVLILSLLAVDRVDSCNTYGNTDGCSIPFGLNYFYSKIFRPDCDKHDVCYACGAKFGISRSSCDSTFYSNIKNRCNSNPNVKATSFCQAVTFDYYLAVRLGGRSHYENTPLSWCNRSWVKNCL